MWTEEEVYGSRVQPGHVRLDVTFVEDRIILFDPLRQGLRGQFYI